MEAFISFDEEASITIQDFDQLESGYSANGKQYMVGLVKLQKLKEWSLVDGVGIILAPNAKFVTIAKQKEKVQLV